MTIAPSKEKSTPRAPTLGECLNGLSLLLLLGWPLLCGYRRALLIHRITAQLAGSGK
jgi:hypothetical protein